MSINGRKQFFQTTASSIKKVNPLVFIVYICVIISFLLIPLILGSRNTFFGNTGGDAPQFIWQSYNLKTVIKDRSTILNTSFFGIDTPYAYTPLSIAQSSLFLAINWVTNNQYVAFNLTTGIFLFLNFVVMYFVLRQFRRTKYVSLLFAVIFAFCPAAIYHSAYHISLFIIFPIPLFILLLFKLKENPNTKNFISIALLYSLTFYIHEYYAILLTFFGIVFILFYRKNLLQLKLLKKIILSVFIIGILLLPFYKFFYDKNTFDAQNNIVTVRDPNEANYYSASPLSFISPSNDSLIYSKFDKFLYQHAVPSEQLHYFGILTITLLIIALINIFKGKLILWERKKMYFFSIFILSLLLSFGPFMIVNYGRIPFPTLLGFNYHITPFDSLRAYGRFGIGAFTVALLFGAYYYEIYAEKNKKLLNPIFIGGIILFSIIEIYPVKYIPRYKIEVPTSALDTIKDDISDDFYVASVPFQTEGGPPLNSHSMLYQTLHNHKIVNGYSSFTNPLWNQKVQKSAIRCFNLATYGSEGCENIDKQSLINDKIKYIIFEKFTETEAPGNIPYSKYKELEYGMYLRFESVISERVYSSDRMVVGRVY